MRISVTRNSKHLEDLFLDLLFFFFFFLLSSDFISATGLFLLAPEVSLGTVAILLLSTEVSSESNY